MECCAAAADARQVLCGIRMYKIPCRHDTLAWKGKAKLVDPWITVNFLVSDTDLRLMLAVRWQNIPKNKNYIVQYTVRSTSKGLT